jgi:DNA binding domain, excisionase family
MPRTPFTPSVTPLESKIYLNTTEIAQLLDCKPLTICSLIRSGALKAAYIGRSYKVRRSDLDSFIDQRAQVAAKRRAA